MFPQELVMDFLRSQGLAMDLASCALIYFSERDSEKESATLSFASAKFRAMEWAKLSSFDVCESVLAPARKLF